MTPVRSSWPLIWWADFLDNYETHQVGGRTIVEYWIPAEDLADLNANIVGLIEVVAEYHQD
jgi:hypothetical protein